MNTSKYLRFDATITKADAPSGIIEGLANVGGVEDLQQDVLEPGAWSKVIREKQEVPFVWGHQVNPPDVRGAIVYLEEWPAGDRRIEQNRFGGKASALFFRAKMALETVTGSDAFGLLKGGFLKDISVNFTTKKSDQTIDSRGVRHIWLVDSLLEISAVIRAASPGSMVLVAKGPTLSVSFAGLSSHAYDMAYDQTSLALAERERSEAREAIRKEALRERTDKAVVVLLEQWERAKEVRAIERLAGVENNYYIAPPPRPLTAEQERVIAVEKMAGTFGNHFHSATTTPPQSRPFTGMI